MSKAVEKFLKILKNGPVSQSVFNPWFHRDLENDGPSRSPEIRRKQLQLYLEQRINTARFLLIAEAVGYQGGHFSGIAMTSERILLGHLAHKKIYPSHVFKNQEPQRTSLPEKWPQGFTEPTATIVWGSLLDIGIDPYQIVLWNAFPWHPFQPEHSRGMLSNRTPSSEEMIYAQPFLDAFLKLFPNCRLLAVGKKSCSLLNQLSLDCHSVRHPANGGATQFRTQTLAFLREHSRP
ncbi:MAG: uracil-DNA glycosylase [SAR324 cluster bacterium]|nr:uracil-DNA glycosylase [SAR324 cluster bacterium]